MAGNVFQPSGKSPCTTHWVARSTLGVGWSVLCALWARIVGEPLGDLEINVHEACSRQRGTHQKKKSKETPERGDPGQLHHLDLQGARMCALSHL